MKIKIDQLEAQYSELKDHISQEIEKVLDESRKDPYTFKIRDKEIDELAENEELSEEASKARRIIKQLKKELLIDLNLNKEFVRNYELAARRLETIFMTQT